MIRRKVSQAFKDECKSNVSGLKLATLHVVEDNLDITESDNLKDFTIEDNCYVNDKFIGTTVSKKITGNILNPDNSIDLENKEIAVTTGIRHTEDTVLEGETLTFEVNKSMASKLELIGNTYQDLTPILPKQYTQLDYIEGTGSQYIDLGYGLGTNSKVEISIDVERSVIDGQGCALFGARTSVTSGYFGIWGNLSWSNNLRWDIANGDIDNKLERGTLRDGNNILIKDGINNYLNGKQLESNIEVEDFEPEYNSYLLAINTAGGVTNIMPAKIRYFKAWIDGTLKYNCLPAQRVSDGEIGLYNLVDGTFFTSASSTSFISGNEVTIPNLNDKREIRACGDNINILITENSSNYTINPDGTYNENINRLCSDFIKVNSNKQDYILSANQSLGFVGIAFYDKDKNYVGREYKNGVKTLAITKPSNVIYLRVFFQGNLLSSQSWFDYEMKLEKGSTATTYSKPSQGSITIKKSNKNLADLTKKSTGISACKIQNKNTNSIELISTNTWSNCWFCFEELKDNSDYVISANFLETVAESARVGISVYGNNVPHISGATNIGKYDIKSINKNVKEIRSVSFNTLNYKYVYIRFWNNYSETSVTEGNSLVKVIDIQLEESPIKTDYVEHQSEEYVIPTQQPMLEGDTFVKIANVWYEKHNWKEVILNGSENWTLTSGVFYISSIKDYAISNNIPLSNYFKGVTNVSGSAEMSKEEDNTIAFINDTTNYRFYMKCNKFSSVEELKTWLSENNVPLSYKIAEPTLIPCTEEQNATLDEIDNMFLYDGKNYVYSMDEISPNFKLSCGKEIISLGNYIIPKPTNDETKDKSKFTGYDYMIKYDIPFIDDNTYPIRADNYLENLCNYVGVKLGSKDFLNNDYMILGNPFTNGESCRIVLSNIAQLAGGFAHIDVDNKLYIVSLIQNEGVEDTIDGNNYMDFNSNNLFGTVNSFKIQMNSGVDGEESVREEENLTDMTRCQIAISDNYFLTSAEEREKVIDNLYANIKGLSYLPLKTTYYGYPWLKSGKKIKVLNVKDEEFDTYVFNHKFIYNGCYKGEIEAKALTKTQSIYKDTSTLNKWKRNTELKVDKINGQISSLVETTNILTANEVITNNNFTDIYSKLGDTVKQDDLVGINNKVEQLQTDTENVINITKNIQVNGVSKVTTTTGFTFNELGLSIEKTNAPTKSLLDEKALSIKDNTGSSEENLLFAGYDEKIGETIVKSKNMTVEKYLTIGRNSRIEDYKQGTGVFWIGGV